MTTFNDIILKEDVGVVWLVEGSTDNFATVSKYWATEAISYSGNQYVPCVAKIGRLSKSFGLNNVPSASTVSMELNNIDEVADFLVNISGGPVELTYRFRLTCVVYEPQIGSGSSPTFYGKTMGIYGVLDGPVRTATTVELNLTDDSMGRFKELAASPTIREWISDGGTTKDNCLEIDSNPVPCLDWDTPIPLAFGPTAKAWLIAGDHGTDNDGTLHTGSFFTHSLVVCATTSSDAVNANDALQLFGTYAANVALTSDNGYSAGSKAWDGAGSTVQIPQTFVIPADLPAADNPLGLSPGTVTIWSAQKTQAITKDGKSWKVLWIAFSEGAYEIWYAMRHPGDHAGGTQPDGSTAPVAGLTPAIAKSPLFQSTPGRVMGSFASFAVVGFPLSSQTTKTQPYQTGIDVLTDLLSYYSSGSSSDLDSMYLANAKAQNAIFVAGQLQPLQPTFAPSGHIDVKPTAAFTGEGNLQKAIAEIAQSIGVDFFFTWAGKAAMDAGWNTYSALTATRVALSENDVMNFRERKPSQGERWAYYNRLFVVGPDGTTRGPFDNQAAITAVGVKISRYIQAPWLLPISDANAQQIEGLWQIGNRIEATQRNLVTFQTDRKALQLELGDLFTLSWSRGYGMDAVFTNDVFHVESLAVDPGTLMVEVEAVWAGDILTSVNPYLLDTESYTTRVSSGGGRTASVTNGSTTVTFSSGSLITDGVIAGDILVLRDATQNDKTFTRNRAIRIASRTDATHLVLDTSDTAFDAASPTTVSSWEIRKGNDNYPNAASDPTHYPDGSAMYGKASGDGDTYHSAAGANPLR